MTRDDWSRIKEIAAGALDEPPSARLAYLASKCGSDTALLNEVESLVESATRAAGLFETPTVLIAGAAAAVETLNDFAPTRVGERIGPYRLVEEIGGGGMGSAYLAVRVDEEFEKRVAIKLIKRGMDSRAVLRRFRHERQILANLDHPHIARLLDGGTTADGSPYFVMEYVEGTPIDVHCERRQLSIRERIALFRLVCDAVEHAHQQRVVHRDLKPSNILVTAQGVPKLLDFGISKVVDVIPDAEPTLLPGAMTPQYASPEQVRGEAITATTDVYSLGVLLYELLAGTRPYSFDGRTRREIDEIICTEEPDKPSAKAPASLRRTLSGDLDNIILCALRKEPARRYASVRELSDDLGRHLDGLPVTARGDDLGYRASRLVRRHRTRLIEGALVAAVVAVIALLAPWSRDTAPVASEEIQSVAVLPLATAGGEPEYEYLSDGITEGIIRRLSRASNVRVIARDSAYRYKGKVVDPQQVGRDLGVQAIVTGRIVHRGSNLTLNVELVDTRDRRLLWGQQFSSANRDVQLLQADLSGLIASSLRLHFSPDSARLEKQDNHDPEAYELYLRGRYFWNRRTVGDFQKSIGYFKQAVEREPDFALAYAGLADSFSLLTEYHGAPARDTYADARAAATRALELDDRLAEAHTSLAYIKHFYEWDAAGAEAEFKRALALNPHYATGHQWYAEFLSAMGRHDEAIAEIYRAADVDPLSLIVNAVEANILYMARRYDEAIAQSLEVIDMDPNFPEVYEYLKRSHDQKGAYREAIEARQARRRILRRNTEDTRALQDAAAATSRTGYWRNRLEQELEESKTEGLLPFEMAEILSQAGDTRAALQWLERACDDNDFMTMYMRVVPTLDPLRAEPGFRALLGRGCRTRN